MEAEATAFQLLDAVRRVAGYSRPVVGDARIPGVERVAAVAANEMAQPDGSAAVHYTSQVARLIESEVGVTADVAALGVGDRFEGVPAEGRRVGSGHSPCMKWTVMSGPPRTASDRLPPVDRPSRPLHHHYH